MSLLSETSSIQYSGDGATVDFQTRYKFLANSDLRVYKALAATPTVFTAQTLGVHYNVTGAGVDAGGDVIFVAAPAVGDQIKIERTLDMFQPVTLTVQGAYSPKTIETELDRVTMICQQLARRISSLEAAGGVAPAVSVFGDGLYTAGATLHAGAGTGLTANADNLAVNFGVAGDFVAVTKAAAVAGASGKVADAAHKHDVSTAAPAAGTVAVGNAASEGVAATLARSDHGHAVTAAAPVAIGTANAIGAAATFPRSDHVHDHGAQTLGTLHAVVTPDPGGTNGFMSSADKKKLDAVMDVAPFSTLDTTDATPGILAVYTPADLKVVVILARVSGHRSTGGQGGGYLIAGTFRRDGGATAQIGATTVIASHEDNAAWDCAFSVSGTDVRVVVTGAAATTVNWKASLQALVDP